MADVNITVDGKKIVAPAGTLLIEACKNAGIEVPSFCYYPGLSLQGACRMCLVRIEKMPKLQTACTTVITEGMTVTTNSDEVRQARKSMLEFVLQNHPLDCPVCDAGGECELQDMTFSYGAAESLLIDPKNHRDEQQWSPVVYFDRPRCIMCYRCVRVCGEGMDVWALGIQNRGSAQVIAPNVRDEAAGNYLWCEECGMCIDICPVGALTSGAYRYKTRPWEMNHVGTICTHCGDGCKTTLGVRRSPQGMDIVRGDNRDKSGINGDFLCIKGRYAFDFVDEEGRIKQPLIRREGRHVPVSWEEAFEHIGRRFKEVRDTQGGPAIGVFGSNRTTNEENYLLQKFARTVLGTNNIDHHRTTDYPAFIHALSGYRDATAGMRELFSTPAMLLIGGDPTGEHPLLGWQIRNNVRLHRSRLYLLNHQPIKLRRQAAMMQLIAADSYARATAFLAGADDAADALATGETTRESLLEFREKLRAEQNLLIIYGSELRGGDVEVLVRFGAALPSAKFVCLGDYANSRGAADMGLFPDLLPGYLPLADAAQSKGEWLTKTPPQSGLNLLQMVDAAKTGALKAFYVVGANPVARYNIDPFAFSKSFLVVQDMFLTETAIIADVVLPAASAYEKSGTFTNTCGDVQLVTKAADMAGTKSDFEMIVRIAERMGHKLRDLVPFGGGMRTDMGQARGAQSGEVDRHRVWMTAHNLEPKMSPFDPWAIFDEIQRLVPGYEVSRLELMGGNAQHTTCEVTGKGSAEHPRELIVPAHDTLFTSGTLGRYSNALNTVIEGRQEKPKELVVIQG